MPTAATLTDLDPDAKVPPLCGPCCRSGEIGRRKGLKIISRGIAQVVDDMGNPLCLYGLQPLAFLFLFVALCLHSPRFVQPANTVITPRQRVPYWFRNDDGDGKNGRSRPRLDQAQNLFPTKS